MYLSAAQTTHDDASTARALVAATEAALSRGDYEAAIKSAQDAFAAHERSGRHAEAAWDLNAIGVANSYLARYSAALDAFRRALDLDRASGAADGAITRLNNIGNVSFMQGRYSDALQHYQEALGAIDTAAPQTRGRLRKMTASNLAALHQRLGADERALDYYGELSSDQTMQPAEEAQLLVNRGALFRRLGDPVKALELYRSAQRLFSTSVHPDGEISAWRNIGIVYALDLADADRAIDAFDAALRLARASSNRRGEAQALLYRGEALRRAGRSAEAARDLEASLDAAIATGLVEEQWKALYGIGRLREAAGDRHGARAAYERALGAIESVRSDLRTLALRSEFLADKRDVYDALIWLRAAERPAPVADVFRLVEASRARTWQDRLQPDRPSPSLADVQARLPADTWLLEYWTSADGAARLWISRDGARLVTGEARPEADAAIRRFVDEVGRPESEWRRAADAAGRVLLAGLPDATAIDHLLIVPDGALSFVPFEALTFADAAVVERFDVSYLPSAALLLRDRSASSRWTVPWRRQLVAFGNPAPAAAYPLETRSLPPLPYAGEEVRRIARELRGAADVHLGADARKALAFDGRLRSVPFVHFATHAVADTRDPDRSRILLAPQAGTQPEYLFLREIYDLDLRGVTLVTLSACETERGKIVRGEGVEGFSRALLAAGASAAVTTMWDVADRPGAEFMTQFYYALGRGAAPAAALRQAKLRFLHSDLPWTHPYFWAGYVLTGDGASRPPRVVPWSVVAAGALTIAAVATALIRARASARRSTLLRRTAD
jgi:tetratricopeptide (TPR) repeat protein